MDSNEYSEKREYKPEKRSRFLEDGKTLAIEARWSNPGPGMYTIPAAIGDKSNLTLPSRPAYKMGTKLPILTHIIHSPGPIYNPTRPHDPNAGFSIGGKRKEERLNTNPGPGSYDLFPQTDSNKGFSMARRKYKEKEDESVAPNHYDIRTSFGKSTWHSKIKNSLGFKFTKRTDLHKKNVTAAASIKSEYNPVFDFVKPQAPRWTMSARNFQDLSKFARELPAPNSYDPVSSFAKKNGKSMGVKYSPFVSTGFIVPSKGNDLVDF